MVQLTQICIISICVTFGRGHLFFGNDHRRVHPPFGELPQMISNLITQNLGNGQLYNHGLYRPGIPGSGNRFGPPSFEINRPSNIFGGNLFGSPDYTGHEGVFNSQESGESLQQPNLGEREIHNIPFPQVLSISNDANLDLTSNGNSETILPNGQNVDLTGQGIVSNINVDVPNIEIPQIEGIVLGSEKQPVNGIISGNVGAQAEDSTKGDLNKPEQLINAVSPIIGQLGQVGLPNSVDDNVNVEGNKNDIGSNVATSGQDNINVNLNSSSDSVNDSHLHVNMPVGEVATDLKLEDTLKEIFKTDGQPNLNVGIDEPKVNVSGISSPNINNSEIKVLEISTNNDGKLSQNESSVAGNLQVDNSTSIVRDDSNQDSTLKTNQVVLASNNLDVKINKHKDSIVFPDQLREAKDKLQKEKNLSQLSKLNDINGFDNGQVFYALNIGSSIVPQNQGVYVSPTSSANDQQAYVNSPSGTPIQYVPQNPSSTVSTTVPSGNIMSTNANGGSTSGGYTLVNSPSGTPVQYVPQNPSSTVSTTVPSGHIMSTNANGGSTSGGYTLVNGPNNVNSNSGQASYYPSTTSAGQLNTYYQVPSSPTQQSYYTVQLSNGQIALVPVNSGQYVQSNGQGQVIVLNNGQQYIPVQSTGQILYSNGQQLVPINSQPMQGNNPYMMTSNGQQYDPNSNQPMQGNGQILFANNGQQYVQATAQPIPSNGQVMVQGNGQQYVQASAQPIPSNGQIMVQGNGQQYVQANAQPIQSNGQVLVQGNGLQYIQGSAQPIQSNGQVMVQGNGQQYVQANAQPIQSNGQVLVQGNGLQYIQGSAQPIQSNGQVMVQGNGQQYVQANAQPIQSNGQVLILANGQPYIQASAQPTQGNGQVIIQGNGQHYMQGNGQPANGQFVVLSNGQNYVPSGPVTVPWSQSAAQNNGQIYVPLNNQNAQSNVPAGSIVTVDGNSNSVPLMVFKEKAESSSKPSSSGDVAQDDEKDKNENSLPFPGDDVVEEIDQEKDEVVE